MTVNLQDPLSLDIVVESNRALSVDSSIDNDSNDQKCATWVHEALAQVRIRVFRGHDDTVTSCQFCDGDTKMLSASHDRSLMLWDLVTGEQLASFNDAHRGNISQARVSQDTSRIVSCGWDQKLHTWNTETGQLLWTGSHGGIVTCCNFSADGKLIISGSDLENVVRIWDAHSGHLIHKIKGLHTSTVTSCSFSPGGDRIITTSMDRSTKFWDLISNRNTITLTGHINIVSDASLTNDERWLATVSWDKNIHISDVSTGMYRNDGAQVIEKAHEGCISSCQFSGDGQQLVTGGFDARVCIWDVTNSTQKLKLQGHVGWVEDVCFSADQKWVLSCSKDKTIRLWNIMESHSVPTLLEKKRAFGMNMYKCEECGKPFSIASEDLHVDIKTCVLCRLQVVKERDSKCAVVSNPSDRGQ
ncbi:hypothetical protein NP493_1544g00031 [Ridgeia piscesae]|uniref:Uncharacterized protein n=1 Tax=Ridgeia piscesae TaxID=27915 RepID=A0AAD9N9P5_RIDPI|nr:hypothetical protein NP493_1544g00031 [Ridgeia piscesae]